MNHIDLFSSGTNCAYHFFDAKNNQSMKVAKVSMKKQTINRTLAAALLMSCASGAIASESAELSVRGEIVPNACSVSIPGGGVVDYGTLSYTDLIGDETGLMPKSNDKTFNINVQCAAPAKVTLTVTDNRRDSRPTPSDPEVGNFVAMTNDEFGLGLSGGKKIGIYTLSIEDSQGDNKKARFVSKVSSGNWYSDSTISPRQTHDAVYSLSASDSNSVPSAFTNHSYKVLVYLWLLDPAKTNPGKVIKLDGQATIELSYL
ncbi:DUF1120 domain-containing protein [Pseudomonas sp. MDT1-17]